MTASDSASDDDRNELPKSTFTFLDIAHIRGVTLFEPSLTLLHRLESNPNYQRHKWSCLPLRHNGPTVCAVYNVRYLRQLLRTIEKLFPDEEDGEPCWSPLVEISMWEDGPMSIRTKESEFYIAPMVREKVEVGSLERKDSQ